MVTRRRHGGGTEGEGKGFLSRWSERKRAAEAGALPEEAEQGGEAAEIEPASGQQASDADPDGAIPAELPEIDSLQAGSDFSVFMKEGVPAALQRRALRKLWQVDPAFNEICMLDDYNLDYTDAAMVVPNLKTSYQVGRGMVLPEELEAELKAAAEQAGVAGPEAASGDEVAELSAPAGEAADPAAAEDSEAQTASPPPVPCRPRRAPRKPGTPLVNPAPTPDPSLSRSISSPGDGGAARSARRRRWGDTDS